MNPKEELLLYMDQCGLMPVNPGQIKPDNKRNNYHLEGDKKAKPHGYCKLEVTKDGFGFAFFGDYRCSECHSWHSKTGKGTGFTEEDVKKFHDELKIERAKHAKQKKKKQAAKAIEAQDSILFLDDCPPDHPYLLKKQIQPYNILLQGNDIVVPMQDEKQVCNYQTIRPDGAKRYMADAKKQGAWFEIPGDETICLVEGYATGATVHEATGHTVIVCFDAGNLKTVAPLIRENNPKRKIIICADNDHEMLLDGRPFNSGIVKGKEAARDIQADIVWPECGPGDSDFNDVRVRYGLDAVKNRILPAVLPCEEPGGEPSALSGNGLQLPAGNEKQNDLWEEQLITNKGKIDPKSTVNLRLTMENHEKLDGVFKHDSFAKRMIVVKCPPWENENNFKVRPVGDFDYFRLESYLEQFCYLKTTKNKCADAIYSTANIEKNTFNPATEYFQSLEWDGVPRLDSWLEKYISDGEQPSEYLRTIGRKFICGLAKRAIKPGCKFDNMVILEGMQDAGKSFLARILATINGVEYFLDDFKDIDNKDALMKMQGKLVVEFPELTTMRKSEVDDLKAFISRQEDEFRPPYGRNTIEAPRQCVFVGTVNPEGPYLRDVTGNRRYWPISCRRKIDVDEMKRIVPFLHAEAAHLVREGESLYLTAEEKELARTEQEKRVVVDIWIDKIERLTIGVTGITTDEIVLGLGMTIDKATPQTHRRIKQTMMQLGWVETRIRMGGTRVRGYKKQEQETERQEEIPW